MPTATEADKEAARKIRLYVHYRGGTESRSWRSWDDVRADIAATRAEARERADAEGYARGMTERAELQCASEHGMAVIKAQEEMRAERARAARLVEAVVAAIRIDGTCPECLSSLEYDPAHAMNCGLGIALAEWEAGGD